VLCPAFFANTYESVPGFGAEVWHIYDRCGIIRNENYNVACGKQANSFAQSQYREGTEKSFSVDSFVHKLHLWLIFQTVHNLVTECADDCEVRIR